MAGGEGGSMGVGGGDGVGGGEGLVLGSMNGKFSWWEIRLYKSFWLSSLS